MKCNIIKRDGKLVMYNRYNIERSVRLAMYVSGELFSPSAIAKQVERVLYDEQIGSSADEELINISIDKVEDATERVLRDNSLNKTYEEYYNYRRARAKYRESNSDLSKVIRRIGIETDRDNANVGNNFSAKLLRIGSEANKWFVQAGILPKEEAKAYENGDVYDHDLDSYNLTINCLHLPTGKILNRGFNTGYGLINKPNSIESAALLSCILLQSSQNDLFGGQSHPNFDNDISEYIMISRKKELARYILDLTVACIDNTYKCMVSDVVDIVQDDIIQWNDDFIEVLRKRYKEEPDFCNDLCSFEDAEALIKDVINHRIQIMNYIKNIPSSDQAEFWKEFTTLWNTENYFDKYSVNFPSGLPKGDDIRRKIEPRVYRAVRQAMQSLIYNLNTMHSRAGAQVPFSSINIGIPKTRDAALLCEILLDEYNKGLGKGEQPIYPNIIFRVKEGVNKNPEDPYYYLFKKACQVAANRMNPTFMNLDSNHYKPFYDRGITGAIMGCRTAVCSNVNGKEGPEGRGNIAPVTINLVRIGIIASNLYPSSNIKEDTTVQKKRINWFFTELSKRLELAKNKLMTRYNTLKKLKVKDIPFSIGQGLMEGNTDMSLKPEDSIDPVLKNGTWAIGFIGIAETLKLLIGEHQGESDKAQELGLAVVKRIREYTDEQTEIYRLNFGCYATPAEGLSNKFTDLDRSRFGVIPGITDKEYYTNSYHIPVDFKISISRKMKLEAPYQYYCNSGCISYIEFDGEPSGDALLRIVSKTFTDNPEMNYMAGNFHKRTCKDCGQTIHSDLSNCPKCGSKNIQGVSRVTGYLSLDERFTKGKTAERRDRIPHGNLEQFHTTSD